MTLAELERPQDIDVICNRWAEPLYQFPSEYDYRIMHGGRASSKTNEITRAIVTLGHISPMRICAAREHLKSIDESAKPELEARIREMGLMRPDCYTVTKTAINHANGTHIFFIGLSKMSEEDIKGLAMVDLLWVEEAHRMSETSWELTDPTIRKDDSEIWLSFNPQHRYQAAWKLAQRTDDPAFWIKQVNWRDNEFFTGRNNRSRLRDQIENPQRYEHIWEGQPDDAGDVRKVLPYGLLQLCVDAWDKRPIRGVFGTSGFDVADTGDDENAWAGRFGPELFWIETWRGTDDFTVSDSARKAGGLAVANGIARLDYDAGGVDPVKGPIKEWIRDTGHRLKPNPCRFGGQVQSGDVIYELARPVSIYNKQYFFNWAAQAGSVLRRRALMTERLVKGEDVDPHDCLFLNPDIPRLGDFMAQMAQPEWSDDTGKLKIDKQPHKAGETEPKSPDAYDAVVLAFSYDAHRGLKVNV